MKSKKRILSLILTLSLLFSVVACAGTPGEKGEKGDKGDTVTVVSFEKTASEGMYDTYTMTYSDGTTYTFAVKNGADGADGENGLTPVIGENGNWWIGTTDTNIKAEGQNGKDGTMVTVTQIAPVGTSGNITTYAMLLSDGTNKTFQVKNGEDGNDGESVSVTSVEKTNTEGLVDTYTITFSNGQTSTFTVTNGKDADGKDNVTITNIALDSESDASNTYVITYSDESSSKFTVTKTGETVSGAYTAYEDALSKGYEGTLNDWVIDSANEAKSALLTTGSVLGAKTLGAAMGKILADYDTYFITNVSATLIREVELGELVQGKYFWSGTALDNSGYYYNANPIPVNEGEILKIVNKDTKAVYGYRFWVLCSGSTVFTNGGNYPSQDCYEILIPEGVDGIIATLDKKNTNPIAAIYKNSVTVAVSDQLDTYNVNTLVNGAGGGGSGVIKDTEAEIIISAVLGSPSILAKAETLPAGQWMYISNEKNTVINNKTLSFSCNIDGTLGADEEIYIGHGYEDYASSYVVLTGTHLKVIEAYSSSSSDKYERLNIEHGLTIKDYINLTIDANIGKAKITLGTSTGMKQADSTWVGRNGKIYAVSIDRDLTKANLRWSCEGYSEKIWLYGDSYFNNSDGQRWPSYLTADGHTNNMMSGYPGMNTETALVQFKEDLKRGTPQYVVWCMGMNNGDKDKDTVNSTWLSCTEEFLEICNEKGITPILTTIPTTPTVFNYAKSEWVRESGYRYIDFSRAVGGDNYDESLIGKEYTKPSGDVAYNVTGNEWYADMLHGDLVHPAYLGAKALYTQVLVDFPEITRQD